jgi:hypothetical protein
MVLVVLVELRAAQATKAQQVILEILVITEQVVLVEPEVQQVIKVPMVMQETLVQMV